jgi:hypothetical protein
LATELLAVVAGFLVLESVKVASVVERMTARWPVASVRPIRNCVDRRRIADPGEFRPLMTKSE